MTIASALDAIYDVEMNRFNTWVEVSQCVLNNESKTETIAICEQDQSIVLERFIDDVDDDIFMEAATPQQHINFAEVDLSSEDINEMKRIKYDPVSHTREKALENKKIATMLVVVYNASHYEKNDNKEVKLNSTNMMRQVKFGYRAKSFYMNEIVKSLDSKGSDIFEYKIQGDSTAKDQNNHPCIITQVNMTLPYEAMNPKLFKICKLVYTLDEYREKEQTYSNEYKKAIDQLQVKYGKSVDEAYQIRRDVCYDPNPKERVYRQYFLSFHLQDTNKEYATLNSKANTNKDPFDKKIKHGLIAAKRLKYQFDL